MILTIIGVTLLVFSIISIVIGLIGDLKWRGDWDDHTFVNLASLILTSPCGILPLCLCIFVNKGSAKNDLRTELEETIISLNATKKTIENYDEDSKVYLVTAINEYNKDVKEFKTTLLQEQRKLKNVWISWFHNPVYAEFDVNSVSYIDC